MFYPVPSSYASNDIIPYLIYCTHSNWAIARINPMHVQMSKDLYSTLNLFRSLVSYARQFQLWFSKCLSFIFRLVSSWGNGNGLGTKSRIPHPMPRGSLLIWRPRIRRPKKTVTTTAIATTTTPMDPSNTSHFWACEWFWLWKKNNLATMISDGSPGLAKSRPLTLYPKDPGQTILGKFRLQDFQMWIL